MSAAAQRKAQKAGTAGNLELPRRLWHGSIGLLVCCLHYLHVSSRSVWFALLPVLVVYGGLDWYRHRSAALNERFCRLPLLRAILRSSERTSSLTSSTYFLMGTMATLVLFSRPTQVLALLYLCWCDPLAAIVGQLRGGRRVREGPFANGKSHVGSAAAALLGTLITLTFLLCTTAAGDSSLWYGGKVFITSCLGGLIAAASEMLTIGSWDDNATMPVIAGLLLTLFTPLQSLYPEMPL